MRIDRFQKFERAYGKTGSTFREPRSFQPAIVIYGAFAPLARMSARSGLAALRPVQKTRPRL
jgi:hypothetical protein